MSHKVRRNKLQESMSNKSKIIIVRHGESLTNLTDTVTGWNGCELSEKGHKQVELLGKALKDEPIDMILSSDLNRAKQTTAAIAKYHNVDTRFIEALRERSYGVFDGKPFDDFYKEQEASGEDFFSYRPKDGESPKSLLIRASNFWRFWASEATNKTLLISAHGTFNKILLMFWLGKTFEDWESLKQDNACINIISRNEKNVFVSNKINDTSHLASLKN